MVSEPDTGQCASEEALPRRGGKHEVVCQQGCWAPKGGGFGGGPTSLGERNECQRGRWDPKEGGLLDPTSIGEESETPFIRVWKPFPSKRVLKTLSESPKRTIFASGGLGPGPLH